MTDHIDKVLAEATARLKEQQAEVVNTKKFINQLLGFAKRPPMFTDIEQPAAVASTFTLLGDEFVGQSQRTACRLILERRRAAGLGPATLDEMYEALKLGGYRSNAKSEDIARQVLYNLVTRNTDTFFKIPNGRFGLTKWYPEAKKQQSQPKTAQADSKGPETPEAAIPQAELEPDDSPDEPIDDRD